MKRHKSNFRSIFLLFWYIIKGIVLFAWWLVRLLWQCFRALFHSVKKSHVKRNEVRPVLAELVVQKTVSGNVDNFLSKLYGESLIIAVCGRRGSGKSAFGFRLLENIHAKTERVGHVLGVKQEALPSWIISVDDVKNVRNGGVVLVDEGALSFSSRNAMSKKNKELGELLAVARHKDLTLVLITQNTGMLDKNVMNLCDVLALKEGSLLQFEMERPVMKKLYERANKELQSLSSSEKKACAYIIDAEFEGLVKVVLPSFWSSKVSKNQA